MEDLTGRVFGGQVVLEFGHKSGDNYYWWVLCDCGSKRLVQAGQLKSGRVTNCNCKRRKDLTGQRFGMLQALHIVRKDKNNHCIWLCQCDCGNQCEVAGTTLLTGQQKSCGCNKIKFLQEANTTHGKAYEKIYRVYQHIIHRCYNASDQAFKNYGGRGISVCDEWKDDRSAFFNWAEESGYKEGLSIDRIDNDGPYSPANCRWADRTTQANNCRKNVLLTWDNKTLTATHWARELGIKPSLIIGRLRRGLPTERVLSIYNLITGEFLEK
jgi:hypothetical protein